MKSSQFLGWIKKAYPQINYATKDDGSIWFSSGRFLQVSVTNEDPCKVKFHGESGNILYSDDSEIVSMVRGLWGNPRVAFVSTPTPPKPKENQEEEKKQPEPRKEEAKKDEKKLISGKSAALKKIHEELGDSVSVLNIPGGKAVEGKNGRLVLYDLGISSKHSEFIPWARKEEVEKVLSTFIFTNKIKQND